MSSLLIFLLLLNAYFLLIFLLVKTGWMKRLNLSLFGPALMVKTERGRGILDWFARARGFFDRAAGAGVWLTAVLMLLMSLVLVIQLFFIFQLEPEQAPSPRYVLGIPGINPIIPVGFGIVALIFAVVVHEFSHGILARVHDLKVKTMGLLFFIVPIGAFVEPDEDELRAAPRSKRVKVFAAGPISNVFFAVVFGVLFSSVLMAAADPIDGVPLQGVSQGEPADAAGLRPGDIVTHVNGTAVRVPEEFSAEVQKVSAGDALVVLTYPEGTPHTILTKRCIEVYDNQSCTQRFSGSEADALNRTVVGVDVYNTRAVHQVLTKPFGSPISFLVYVSLPFQAIRGQFPLAGIYTQFYDAPFSPDVFWFLVNLAYWLFWIDLMLGLTNALPIVPLDGGHIFKDFVAAFVHGWDPNRPKDRTDRTVKRVSVATALTLLVLVLLQFVGPYLAALV